MGQVSCIYAVVVIATLPILLLMPFIQKQIQKGCPSGIRKRIERKNNMAGLELKNIFKVYDNAVMAVNNFNLKKLKTKNLLS